MKKNFDARLNTKLGAPAKWALIICTLIFVSAANAHEPSGGSAAGLDGQWYHDGKPTRIFVAPDGRSITIVNEFGERNDGYANGPRNLVIPSLGISGEVNKKRATNQLDERDGMDTRTKEFRSGFWSKS